MQSSHLNITRFYMLFEQTIRSEHSFRYRKSQAKCINFWLDGNINIHRLVYRLPVYLELHVPGAGKGERGDAGYGDPLLP